MGSECVLYVLSWLFFLYLDLNAVGGRIRFTGNIADFLCVSSTRVRHSNALVVNKKKGSRVGKGPMRGDACLSGWDLLYSGGHVLFLRGVSWLLLSSSFSLGFIDSLLGLVRKKADVKRRAFRFLLLTVSTLTIVMFMTLCCMHTNCNVFRAPG